IRDRSQSRGLGHVYNRQVDNHPNDFADLNSFDIGWAVDAQGHPVDLPGVDFIRVYTGLNQYCGWLGETSTELSRARDLHINLPGIPIPDPLSEKPLINHKNQRK
ncbi:MAG: hypothetical protein K2L81_01895, partial [Muribaculaceae bacterium]|nr:hypothetical protein [Muribaculaceae bacterium]